MVDPNTLEHSFRQKGNSCILASYGIASSHLTQYSVEDFFQDYCKEIDKESVPSAEEVYDEYFHDEYRTKKVPGYHLIIDLHEKSSQSSFAETRKVFDIEFIQDVDANMQRIENSLMNEVALLSGSFPVGTNYHSALFGYFNNSFYYIDTRPAQVPNGIVPTNSLANMKIGDGILLTKI